MISAPTALPALFSPAPKGPNFLPMPKARRLARRAFLHLLPVLRHGRRPTAQQRDDRRDREKNDRDEEHQFSRFYRHACDAAKAEKRGDQGNDKKSESPA